MSVLVDTSVWIDYFRGGNNSANLDFLIDENLLFTNDIVLAELIPFLKIRNQKKIVDLLKNINKLDLSIDWHQIIEYQYKCIKTGLNGVGLPDLIIAQNAIQNCCEIYSLDNHFILIQDVIGFQLHSS